MSTVAEVARRSASKTNPKRLYGITPAAVRHLGRMGADVIDTNGGGDGGLTKRASAVVSFGFSMSPLSVSESEEEVSLSRLFSFLPFDDFFYDDTVVVELSLDVVTDDGGFAWLGFCALVRGSGVMVCNGRTSSLTGRTDTASF